jgi:hypothetical protein
MEPGRVLRPRRATRRLLPARRVVLVGHLGRAVEFGRAAQTPERRSRRTVYNVRPLGVVGVCSYGREPHRRGAFR